MRRFIMTMAALSLASIGLGEDKAQLKDEKDKVSYSIGLSVGSNFQGQVAELKKRNIEINLDAALAGVRDGLNNSPQMTEDQVKETLTAFQKRIMEAEEKADKEAGARNASEGEKFLGENKKKDGVKTTASGLQYKVLKEGNGAQPKESDTVTVNYRGTMINGTEFDSSYKRGEPATFAVNGGVRGVIKGWTEALQLMKKGAKYQLFVPSNLAYGQQRRSEIIGPNSTLIFEVELMDIKPGPGGSSPTTSPLPK